LAKRTSHSTADTSGGAGPYSVAVLVPCYNEEAAVAKVVNDFRVALPDATIFVFDNNSTDNTAAAARAAGAEV
jgi:glycosyltransferase involved in cell wall biosynthesis